MTENKLVPPGVHLHLSENAYHADPAFSRSFAWTAYDKTWAHAVGEERKKRDCWDFGSAVHRAILEPDRFEDTILCGPETRRGNEWKNNKVLANATKQILLIEKDYEKVLRMRDAVHANNYVNQMLTQPSAMFEPSAFWIDKETEERCRIRPDLALPKKKILLDLKSAVSASAWNFEKHTATYGYHLQDAMYRVGWEAATKEDVEGYVFLVVEKEPPFAHALFELGEASTHEGYLVFRRMLDEWHEHKETGHFPGYSETIQALTLPSWAFHESMKEI